jgi:hypothetical protein
MVKLKMNIQKKRNVKMKMYMGTDINTGMNIDTDTKHGHTLRNLVSFCQANFEMSSGANFVILLYTCITARRL